ncbi:hypothetical protein GOODEAATRI_008883, partial [Goodea atripinnis]
PVLALGKDLYFSYNKRRYKLDFKGIAVRCETNRTPRACGRGNQLFLDLVICSGRIAKQLGNGLGIFAILVLADPADACFVEESKDQK